MSTTVTRKCDLCKKQTSAGDDLPPLPRDFQWFQVVGLLQVTSKNVSIGWQQRQVGRVKDSCRDCVDEIAASTLGEAMAAYRSAMSEAQTKIDEANSGNPNPPKPRIRVSVMLDTLDIAPPEPIN